MAVAAPSSRLVPRLALGVVLLAPLACDKKGAESASKSTTPTIEAAPDDVVPRDTTTGADRSPGAPVAPVTPSSVAPASLPPPTAATVRGSEVIGYDSAFGPRYELDSAGRPIPLRKRKP